MIINMNGGGSGGGATGPLKKSAIVVSYPAGSTCTVTNGSDSYTALDTSGAAAFIVEPGTWTVTATDGDKTTSTTVIITAEGQSESVKLEFDLWLIKDGQDVGIGNFTVLYGTGKYADTEHGKAYVVRCVNTHAGCTAVRSVNTFDLSQYSSIEIRGWIVDNFNHETFKVAVQQNAVSIADVAYSEGEGFTTEVPTVRTIDISAIDDVCNIAVTYSSSWVVSSTGYAELYIDQLKLIP